jgi:ferrous iron transport protein B
MDAALLVGKPNCGKTLLFNKLTGLSQKVANFPGVTVEIKRGSFDNIELVDFPGTYSLSALTIDEKVAVDQFSVALANQKVKVVVCILDATRLERSLVFALQAREMALKSGKHIIFALNMMDEIKLNNLEIDVKSLAIDLKVEVIAVSAKSGEGVETLKNKIKDLSILELLHAAEFVPPSNYIDEARALYKKYGPDAKIFFKGQNRFDKFFLSSWLGGPLFLMIMLVLFQSIFTWSEPLMGLTEDAVAWLSSLVTMNLNDGILKDFLNDAIFGGLGSFVVFVPQIVVLTFIIGILEDSGYLARAALICHRPLSFFGLSGRSFIPFLSGHACAIPAIMAARTIESPRKRLITILTIPLTVCSARLPVYALLTTVLIADEKILGGLVGYRGIAFFGLYLFGLICALIVSSFLNKFMTKKEKDTPFIIELPPYRMPGLKPLLYKASNAGWAFLTRAGLVIFTVTVIIWILGYFPQNDQGLAGSYLGSMGHFIEPLFSPLGLDWKYGVAIITSFAAREVFVGTLGTMFGMEGADENIDGLAAQVSASGLTLASGFALLVFYAIALQCVATVAVIQKETGSKTKAWGIFAAYFVLAYGLGFVTYSILA